VEEARKRLSQDQFQVWFNHLVGPMVVFPNFALDQTWVSYGGTGIPFIFVRVYRPVSPRLTEVWSWFVVERDAPEDFKRASYRAYASSFDPAGNFIADDVENFENVTTSSAGVYNVREVEDLYRGGSHRPVLRRTEELTIYDTSFREEVAVSYWLRWIAYLTGRV
jgi:Ring hydroxylating alpha subunit (catalytic domain).